MRFVFVTLGYHPHPIGGAWRYAAEVAERLAARGHEVTVITGDPENNLPARETLNDVRLRRFPNARGNFFLSWRRRNAAARALLDEALAEGSAPALVGLHHAFLGPAVAHRKEPLLYLFHGPWAEEYLSARNAHCHSLLLATIRKLIAGQLRKVEHTALNQARQIVVLSRYMEKLLHGIHGELPAPIKVVPGGVNLQQFKPSPWRDEVRQRAGLSSSRPYLFLSPRRLDPRMGLDVLLKAYARAVANPQVARSQLWLTGSGPEAGRLTALIAALGLQKMAKLTGRLSDEQMVDVLCAADCAIIPSLELEGFGLATAEALACGTPVLGSLAGATPELLAELDPHLLFPPNSVEALAQKLEAILRIPENKTALPTRIQCRHYAELRFSWDTTVNAIEEIAALRTAGGGV